MSYTAYRHTDKQANTSDRTTPLVNVIVTHGQRDKLADTIDCLFICYYNFQGFVWPAYFSRDHSRLGWVSHMSSKENLWVFNCWCEIILQAGCHLSATHIASEHWRKTCLFVYLSVTFYIRQKGETMVQRNSVNFCSRWQIFAVLHRRTGNWCDTTTTVTILPVYVHDDPVKQTRHSIKVTEPGHCRGYKV